MKTVTLEFYNGEKHSIKWNPGIKYDMKSQADRDWVKPECMFALMIFFGQIKKDFSNEYLNLKSVNGIGVYHNQDTIIPASISYGVEILNDGAVDIIVGLVNDPLINTELAGDSKEIIY